MSQIILLMSIWSDRYPRHGAIDPVYVSRCTGRKLPSDEVMSRRLATSKDIAWFSSSRTVSAAGMRWRRDGGEIAEWYEVSPGDQVTFVIRDFNDGDETLDGTFTFTIPEGDLPDPPVRLDDVRLPSGPHKYYLEHAIRVS